MVAKFKGRFAQLEPAPSHLPVGDRGGNWHSGGPPTIGGPPLDCAYSPNYL